jgi:hypothetical protein
LAHNLASPYLGHELKARVATNTLMGVYDLKIGLMEYVLSCPVGIA